MTPSMTSCSSSPRSVYTLSSWRPSSPSLEMLWNTLSYKREAILQVLFWQAYGFDFLQRIRHVDIAIMLVTCGPEDSLVIASQWFRHWPLNEDIVYVRISDLPRDSAEHKLSVMYYASIEVQSRLICMKRSFFLPFTGLRSSVDEITEYTCCRHSAVILQYGCAILISSKITAKITSVSAPWSPSTTVSSAPKQKEALKKDEWKSILSL